MSVTVEDYYEHATFQRMKAFADTKETPFLVIDTATVKRQLEELITGFSNAKIYYAVKANPAAEILEILRDRGCNFDIASIYELDRVLSLGITGDRISYGNTIKKSKDIRYFYDKGVRLYATDSEADLRNIAKAAPGSKIYVRILTEGTQTADWPLSRKFGCQTDIAMDLLITARDLGLEPYGISFHVGSQQTDLRQWDRAVGTVARMFTLLAETDINLRMVNIGGGFPAQDPGPGAGDDDGASLLIENVAVSPAAQGTGLGRELMDFAERQARARGLRRLALYTNEVMVENLAIYARLGYRETARRTEDGYRRVFMEKLLPD